MAGDVSSVWQANKNGLLEDDDSRMADAHETKVGNEKQSRVSAVLFHDSLRSIWNCDTVVGFSMNRTMFRNSRNLTTSFRSATLIVLVMGAFGCDQANESPAIETANESATNAVTPRWGQAETPELRLVQHGRQSAQDYLKATFARYRNARSYHDRGRVRLSVVDGGKSMVRTAPMSIWMDQTDVDLVAYDVRITIERSVLLAWVVDPASDNMDSQVMQVSLPLSRGRPSLEPVLADPILAGRLAAGLAGPPPQLEWLFANDPMSGLFVADHQFRFLADDRIDKRLCRCVQVSVLENNQTAEFRFYIDAAQGIIRRIDLPTTTIPGSDGKPMNADIRIELPDASFQPPKRRSLRNGFPQSPTYVGRFVPVPLPPPSNAADVPPQLRDAWDEQVQQYQSELQKASR